MILEEFKRQIERDPSAIEIVIEGKGSPFKALFDFNHKRRRLDGKQINASGPVVLCSVDDIEGVEVDDMVTVNGKEIRIIGIYKDPFGRTQIDLESDQGLDKETVKGVGGAFDLTRD